MRIQNSLCAWRENRRFGKRARGTRVDPPLFLLGIWRSGTTYLHNLLARDDRFAYANNAVARGIQEECVP